MRNFVAKKKPHNLSLDINLVREAKDHDINLSQAAEEGIARALKIAAEKRWLAENRAAIESSNGWVEENDLPLAAYRKF